MKTNGQHPDRTIEAQLRKFATAPPPRQKDTQLTLCIVTMNYLLSDDMWLFMPATTNSLGNWHALCCVACFNRIGWLLVTHHGGLYREQSVFGLLSICRGTAMLTRGVSLCSVPQIFPCFPGDSAHRESVMVPTSYQPLECGCQGPISRTESSLLKFHLGSFISS